MVGGEVVDSLFAVGGGGSGVRPGGFEATVSHEFGDEDQVDAITDEVGTEGVAQVLWGPWLCRMFSRISRSALFRAWPVSRCM